MHHRKLAFCSLFLYYSANTLSTVLAIMVNQQKGIGKNEILYLLLYFIIFGLDKLFCIGQILVNETSKLSWIFDIFQVGFIYYPFKMIDESYLLSFLVGRAYPQTFLQLIFFFYAGLLRNIHLSNTLKITIAINYILFIVDIIALSINFEIKNIKKRPKISQENFLTIFPYYISIATLSYYTDSSGLNLVCYEMFIQIFRYLGILVIKYPKLKHQHFLYILYLLSLNNPLSTKQTISKNKIFFELSTYFSQLLRCVILISFSHSEIFDFQKISSDYVKYIFTYLTFGLTLLEFVLDFQKICIFLFKTKICSIQRVEDISNINKKLNNRNNNQILVQINLENQQQVQEKIKQKKFKNEILILAEKICQSEHEQYMYFKNRKQFFEYLDCYYETILIDFQNIYKELLQNIILLRNEKNYFFKIIISRTEKGFLFTKPTKKMIEKIDLPHLKSMILHNQSSNLQLTCFYKYLNEYMSFDPKQIIYDLYDT